MRSRWQALFERVARPFGGDGDAGVWLAGRRLVAIDGTCLDVADTAENEAFFGRPGVNKGEQAAFPQARVVALAECGTHAIFDAEVGAVHASRRPTLAEQLCDRLEPGMLLLADRGFFAYALWRKAIGDRCGPVVAGPHRSGRPQPDASWKTCPTGPGWPQLRRSTGSGAPPASR